MERPVDRNWNQQRKCYGNKPAYDKVFQWLTLDEYHKCSVSVFSIINETWPPCLCKWRWPLYTSDVIRAWILLKHLGRNTKHRVVLILTHTQRPLKGYMCTTGLTYQSSCRVMLHTHSFDTPTTKLLQTQNHWSSWFLFVAIQTISGKSKLTLPVKMQGFFFFFFFFFHREQSRFYLPTAKKKNSLGTPFWLMFARQCGWGLSIIMAVWRQMWLKWLPCLGLLHL